MRSLADSVRVISIFLSVSVFQDIELDINDFNYFRKVKRVEYYYLIKPVQEFRFELAPDSIHHFLPHLLFLFLKLKNQLAAYIGSHNNDCIFEIYGPPMAVREPPVIKYLEQYIEDIWVRFLYFI